MTVSLELSGPEASRPYIEAAHPQHPSLLDPSHQMDALFGVVNIPNVVWIDEASATDILWTLNHPDVWQLLVLERGWTPEQFEAWFADAACAQLLAPRKPRRSRAVG